MKYIFFILFSIVTQNYIDASTFSYGAEDGGNAKYLTDIAIRMHSDLNLDYLLN
jgi:hypothetical protein